MFLETVAYQEKMTENEQHGINKKKTCECNFGHKKTG